MTRYLHKPAARDTNEAAIIAALEAVGASVTAISAPGMPDLLVGLDGRTHLLEIKHASAKGKTIRQTSGGKRPDARGLTEAQQKWWAAWRGAPPVIVRTPAEALAAIGVADSSTSNEGGKRATPVEPELRAPVDLGPPRIQLRATEEACAARTNHAEIPGRGECACGRSNPRCSFCGRSKTEAKYMVSGPRVFICDECIDLCTEIVAEQRAAAEDRTRKCTEPACIMHLNHQGTCTALQAGERDPWVDHKPDSAPAPAGKE